MNWGGEVAGPGAGSVGPWRRCRGFAVSFSLGLILASLVVGTLAPREAGARETEIAIRVLLFDDLPSVVVDGRVQRNSARFAAPGPHEVDGRHFRGSVELIRERGGLRVLNELPLEDYVAGTVLGEVSEGFGDVVMRAQSIAIRTYALYQRIHPRSPDYDVEAGTSAQVYLGMDGETPAARAAVAATRDQILTFDGEPILAAFHSAAGGRTASAAEVWGRPVPYLLSVGVPGEEDSPDTYWRAPVSAAEIGAALAADGKDVGRVRDLSVTERSTSGRSAALRVRGSEGDVVISGETLRRLLGATRLRSTLFEVRRSADGFVFVGSGSGHGVGMSQWGARALAQRGADARAILARFYPGASIERISSRTALGAGAASALVARGPVAFGVSR
jgi:stage II sporulation protein D